MPADPPDFEGLLRRLGARFDLTPTDCLRLQRTSVILVSRGIGLDSADALPWLAPVVCRSPAEQQHFYESFSPPPPGGEAGGDGGGSDDDDDKDESREQETKAGPGAARLALYFIFGAILLFIILRWAGVGFDPSIENSLGNAVEPIGADPPPPEPGQPPPVAMGAAELGVRIALALVLLAGLAIRWRSLVRRSRRRLKEIPAPDTALAEQAAVAAGLANLFTSLAFRHGLGALRRHQAVESRRLHVGRTIRATIKAGGRPVLRYGVRPRTPEYVLLADRESPRDHLPLLADILAQRMAEERINATHYEYYVDPRRLHRISPDPDSAVKLLPDLLPSHPGARLMMVAERRQCLDRHGRAASWFEYLTGFDRPALLDPAKAGGRPERLPLIDDAALLAVPATPFGILAYARSLSGNADDRRQAGESAGEDLPQVLARRRDLYLDDLTLEPTIVEALVDALEEWLGPGGMRLLRMTALHPLVDPGLTIFLGSRSSPPLLDESVLLRISRLPWFRTGIYPQWLRLALVRGLAPSDLEFGTRHIQAYLTARSGDLDEALRRADDEQARQDFVAWLRGNPGSEFHDLILVDALLGKAPEDIGEDGKGARGRLFEGDTFERWLAWFWAGLAALAPLYALILLGLFLVRPGVEFVPPDSVTAENLLEDINAVEAQGVDLNIASENTLDNSGEGVGNIGSGADLPDNRSVNLNAASANDNAMDALGNAAAQEGGARSGPGQVTLRDCANLIAGAPTQDCLRRVSDPDLAGQLGVARGPSPLNVRSVPSLQGSVLMRLPPGQFMTLVGQSGDWWRVKLQNGTDGFVVKALVSILTPTSVPPPGQRTPDDLPGCCENEETLAVVRIDGDRALTELSGAIRTVMAGLDVSSGSRLGIHLVDRPGADGSPDRLTEQAEALARSLLRKLPERAWYITHREPVDAARASSPIVYITKSAATAAR